MTNDNKELLRQTAEVCAMNFSRKDRKNNYNNETFTVSRIKPLSATRALVYFQKEPTGKVALADFILIRGMNKWIYYFLSDGHMINLHMIADEYQKVEQYNFDR